MDVIQQLKENCRPFGLMSEEMQEKAKEMDKKDGDKFQRWQGVWNFNHAKGGGFSTQSAYRLRPDYQEEPEIVEVRCPLCSNCDRGVEEFQYENRGYEFAIVPSDGNTIENMPYPVAVLFRGQK